MLRAQSIYYRSLPWHSQENVMPACKSKVWHDSKPRARTSFYAPSTAAKSMLAAKNWTAV